MRTPAIVSGEGHWTGQTPMGTLAQSGSAPQKRSEASVAGSPPAASSDGHDHRAGSNPAGRPAYAFNAGSITLDGMHIASVTGNAEAIREMIRKANAADDLAEATSPFADIADDYDDRDDDNFEVWKDFDFLRSDLKLKRFRAIRAALARYRGEA